MAMDVVFWVVAVLCIGSALAVVFVRNVFRAALFLVLCFFTVAGVYVALSADFLAAAQVLIYVGAIGVLIIFAIMMTREYRKGSPAGRLRLPALLVAILFIITMVFVVVNTDWNLAAEAPEGASTTQIANAIFDADSGFVLAFEIAGALLLAAVIGAIVLVKNKSDEDK